MGDPVKRLAAAVINKAIEDYVTWHSPEAQKMRRDYAIIKRSERTGGIKQGEWRRLGWNMRKSGMPDLRRIALGDDPFGFLTSDSFYHVMAGVDPEEMRDRLKTPGWAESAARFIREESRRSHHWNGEKMTHRHRRA